MEASAIDHLAKHGIRHTVCPIGSSSLNPIAESLGIFRLARELRNEKPDIVHCVSPKGILYGGIAAKFTQAKGIVFAVSGMGFLFTSDRQGTRGVLRKLYMLACRLAYGHRNKRVIVQNPDDHSLVVRSAIAKEDEIEIINGSGVKLEEFEGITDDNRKDLVLLPARLLRDKGVVEFLDAAAEIKNEGFDWEFMIAGAGDYQNPSSVPAALISEFEEQGFVKWTGYMEDIRPLYATAKIVCLPSYREGMPKCLLEAAAAGCAVVTTDVPGCRDAIMPGETGDLVPPRDAKALATALKQLMSEPERIRAYAAKGRALAKTRFDLSSVVARNLAIYDELMKEIP